MAKSINQKTRRDLSKARFVPVLETKSKNTKFKYRLPFINLSRIGGNLFPRIKRLFNITLHNIKKIGSVVSWKKLLYDSFIWVVEAGVEGFLINFSLNQLFNFPLTPLTIFAYGILIKEGISICLRLKERKEHGSITKVF